MAISGEWDLLNKIEKLIKKQGIKRPDLIKGIGDDAAVFKISEGRYGLLTTDISIENRHFSLNYASGKDIGYKAMAANISDIIAMGGKPSFAFISMACPHQTAEKFIEEIYQGMLEAANPVSVIIAGGDISAASEIVLNIALYGEVKKEELILRSTASAGNYIYLTGKPGSSQAGLQILENERGSAPLNTNARHLIYSHLRPPIRQPILDKIKKDFAPTAMIDISDGLLSDLGHICAQSNKGFILEKSRLPVSEELDLFCQKRGSDPYLYILTSGEEYELLFTSAKKSAETVFVNRVPVNCIGRITDNDFLIDKNGTIEKIDIKGYDHFK